jgi:uncharacterized membrane protein YeiH
MLGTFMAAIDLIGVAVFAVTGALVASRKQMDVFGFALLGTVTGLGGGTLRDLLLGLTPVFWVREPVYVMICVSISAVVFFTAHIPESRYRLLLWLDAVGLAFFCIVGAQKALAADAGAFIALVMGVMTATFGGIVRDMVVGEVPLLLHKEIYVTAALAGSLVFVGLLMLSLPQTIAAVCGFAACFAVRASALRYGWALPTYKPRPGRTPEQVEKL